MGYFFSLFLFSLSKSATNSALNWSEVTLFLFGIVLVVGLIGEYKTLEPHSRRMKLFEMLVIIGVAGELLSDGGIFLFSHQLQVVSDQEISQANVGALDAKSSADAAAGDARRAKNAADELEERLLEQGPRNLLLYGKREERFLGSISQVKGQKVQVRICQFGDNEVRDTAERLTEIFKSAEWTVSPHSPDWGESNCAIVEPNKPVPSGIWVGTPNPYPDSETQERARNLVKFLGQIPLAATLHRVGIETGRGSQSRTTIQGRYGAPDSIVVTVLEHPSSQAVTRNSTSVSPIPVGP